jgi:hypothetical protein
VHHLRRRRVQPRLRHTSRMIEARGQRSEKAQR